MTCATLDVMRPACSVCGADAALRCARCGIPVCDRDLASADDRCETCEASDPGEPPPAAPPLGALAKAGLYVASTIAIRLAALASLRRRGAT